MRLALGFCAAMVAFPAAASDCFQFVRNTAPGFVKFAQALPKPAVTLVKNAEFDLKASQVGLRFIAHSTYLIETGEGLQILTDWSGDFQHHIDETPDVITMNHAHETHWTASPDPDITHALKGWGSGGKPAEHYLELGASLIRNVPTDIRSYGGEPFGNSIFIFEHGGLCIGHLGHLHHEPTEDQYAAIGRLDIVMAPVDGTYTLGVDDMVKVLKRMRARVVLPMHAFGSYTLAQFLTAMKSDFEIEYNNDNDLTLSATTLPDTPTVIVPKGL